MGYRTIVGILLLIFFLLFFPVSGKTDEPARQSQDGIQLFYDTHNPYFSTDNSGRPVGTLAAQVSTLIADSPIAIHLVEDSWPRALNVVLSERNACLVPLTRTKDRENKFQWIGPLGKYKFGLYALKARRLKLETIEDAAALNLVIGVVADESTGNIAKSVPGLRRQAVTASALNYRKLLAGRIDLWLSRDDTAQSHITDETRDLIEKILDLPKLDMGIGCNINSDRTLILALQSHFLKTKPIR